MPVAGEIVFELERFELEGDRLELSGRWFGVRGRRFVRPTLTPLGGHDRSRMLADLEHKPWAAQDGELWEAAFPWMGNGGVAKFELSVAPDLSIELPGLGARAGRSRRLTAVPRRPLIEPGWRFPDPDRVEESSSSAAPELAPPEAELERVRRELDDARAQLEGLRAELVAARGELAERDDQLKLARGDSDAAASARAAAASAAADAIADVDRAASERDRWKAEHDRVLGDLDELARERDQLAAELGRVDSERNQLAADLARAQAELTELGSALRHARAELDQAARRRDQAISAHGAALVMRRAARAEPHYAKPSEWWRPIAGVVGLIAIVFAILIVAHIL